MHNRTLETAGPSPGVLPLVISRRKLVPSFSFNRVSIRSSIQPITRSFISQEKSLTTESRIEFDRSIVAFPRVDSADVPMGHKGRQAKRYRLVPIDE